MHAARKNAISQTMKNIVLPFLKKNEIYTLLHVLVEVKIKIENMKRTDILGSMIFLV